MKGFFSPWLLSESSVQHGGTCCARPDFSECGPYLCLWIFLLNYSLIYSKMLKKQIENSPYNLYNAAGDGIMNRSRIW